MRPIVDIGEQPRNAIETQRRAEREPAELKRKEDDAVRVTRSHNVPNPNQVVTSGPKEAAGAVEASEPTSDDLEKRQELDRTA